MYNNSVIHKFINQLHIDIVIISHSFEINFMFYTLNNDLVLNNINHFNLYHFRLCVTLWLLEELVIYCIT